MHEDRKLRSHSARVGPRIGTWVSPLLNLLFQPLVCCLGDLPACSGPESLHIVGPSSRLGHAGPACAWWGEEGKPGTALTELGFGGQLSSRFGGTRGPCSWMEREGVSACQPRRIQRLLRPTFSHNLPVTPPGPMPRPGTPPAPGKTPRPGTPPTPAPGPNPTRVRRTNP